MENKNKKILEWENFLKKYENKIEENKKLSDIEEEKKLKIIKRINKLYLKKQDYDNEIKLGNRRIKQINDSNKNPIFRFIKDKILPSKSSYKRAKATLYKILTVAIATELVFKFLAEEKREFFDFKWGSKTLASATGFIIYDLFTSRTALKVNKELKSRSKLGHDRFVSNLLTDFIKNFTHTLVMAITIYIISGEFKGIKSIIFGTLLSLTGTVLFEIIFGSNRSNLSDEDFVYFKHTDYYKRVNFYSSAIARTLKSSLGLIGSHVATEGHLNIQTLLRFITIVFALPLFFLKIEPQIISDCGML